MPRLITQVLHGNESRRGQGVGVEGAERNERQENEHGCNSKDIQEVLVYCDLKSTSAVETSLRLTEYKLGFSRQ